MTINEIQDEIIEEFSEIEDWMDRYQLIIDLGEEGDVLPASEKNESNLIDGCQSRVWIVCDQQADGTLVVVPGGRPDDPELLASLLAASDVLGTGWFGAVAAQAGPGKTIAVVGDGQISDNPMPRKAMMPPCTTANRGPIRDTRASPVNRPISCAPCNPTKAMPATNGMTSNCRSR